MGFIEGGARLAFLTTTMRLKMALDFPQLK